MTTHEEVCVHVAAGEFAAQQIRAFLESHEIPCEFQGEALRNTHGFTLDGLGEVRICVGPDYMERARELLERVKAGELSLDDSTDTGQPL